MIPQSCQSPVLWGNKVRIKKIHIRQGGDFIYQNGFVPLLVATAVLQLHEFQTSLVFNFLQKLLLLAVFAH